MVVSRRAILVLMFVLGVVGAPPVHAQDDAFDEPIWGRGGFAPLLGGLPQTSGSAIGIQYDAFLRHPNLTLAADARVSVRRYVGLGVVGGYRGDLVSAYAFARYNYMPGEIFYGIGPRSSRSERGDYRIDEYQAGSTLGLKITDHVAIGANAALIDYRFGDGRLGDTPPVEDVFQGELLAGLGADTRYVPVGVWIELDTRRLPRHRRFGTRVAGGTPTLDGHALGTNQGYYLAAEFRPAIGMNDASETFSQWEVEAQYAFPLRFSADGVVLRLHTTGIVVGDRPAPFYLLPSLGGSHSIRGFRPARFRDHNAWVANVEYRRNIFFFADAAIFVDAGQVFYDTSDLALDVTEFGYGVGLLARFGRFIVGRIDVAHSREGFQVYLRAGSFL
jgi:hypothetical protein